MRAETRRWRPRYLGLAMAAAGTLCLLAVSPGPNASAASRAPATPTVPTTSSAAAPTALWPRFSTPRAVLVADATGLSDEDLLTATTLEGLYNAARWRPRRSCST
jgi:hypothetical protein